MGCKNNTISVSNLDWGELNSKIIEIVNTELIYTLLFYDLWRL